VQFYYRTQIITALLYSIMPDYLQKAEK